MKIRPNLALVGSGQYGLSSPYDCSVWALRGDEGVVLIDSGCGAATKDVLDNVRRDLDSPVVAVLATHFHADHARGLRSLREMTGCQVYAPEPSRASIEAGDEEATGLRKAREAGVYPDDFVAISCPVDHATFDGVPVQVAGLTFLPIHVRGHSRDHFCYLHNTWLFSGDAVFYGGILGLINADGSDMAGYRCDFGKIAYLEIDGLFPGHGMFTLTGAQKHVEAAARGLRKGTIGRQIGQWDLIF